ncbi:choline TMA-lyase-activating enzyme [Clostridium sp. MT-14]|uniref:Choline trimethylamine-lyase activating enzyme n=1 Tax=Clostridium aromativorans TaxID=2836848 RepID=A0ABS8N0X0_9CLOT|nr:MULTISPECIES: choline TMA-lyase-activating enzyme [Clostridium]KAA8674403.1 choline TMA-lyase-activating enzyme [Clostridium sp. HV4-5-A1G]MCC9293442.1 choline TMA-lyase-activating enzyme [Clostridium aromativorans]CAB1252688.1 Choline trimethylamine-lyase activating enzyme [Clostridiaceae bacterium BL-3]
MSDRKGAITERKAFIFNVQKYNMYDGPGVRTLVFFKGCPLRCRWCANPEGLERKYQVMFKRNSCIDCGACVSVCPVGIHTISEKLKHEVNHSIDCLGCRKCENVCPQSALSVMGEVKTVSELMEIIEEDRRFYDVSGGGVTLGGGEVTMQWEFAASLLMACKQEGINTAIETCGYAKLESMLKIAEFLDLFLFDIKHIDSERHYQLTGVHNERILNNLKELLHRRYNVKVRMPLLKGINDSQNEIESVIDFLMPFRDYKNFKGIDLLPYHKLGVNKYVQLGREYPIKGDPSLSSDELDRIESWIKKYEFPVAVIKH